jgi:hypothetical protein
MSPGRARAGARAVVALGTVLGLLAGAGEAAAAAPPVAYSDCLPPPVVRPSELLLACGDGTQSFTVARWTRWSRESARAVGTAEINDCTPSCVAGKAHRYRAIVLLDRPRSCGGRRLFTRLRLFTRTSAGGASPVGSLTMCPR